MCRSEKVRIFAVENSINMKYTITFVLAMMIVFAASSQRNVTKFLGIPIDGTKSAMIQKLKAKGFTYDASKDVLSGEFNGCDVNLYVVTNNDKVYRIMVVDAVGSTEGQIKVRFNTLCKQFEKNNKYVPADFVGDYAINEDEDLSYEIGIHEKRYEAAYFQYTEADQDTTGLAEWALNRILEKYTQEELDNMSEEEGQLVTLQIASEYVLEKIANKSVWFMITERWGRYYINMYYDNELNQANGEDL